MGKVFAVGVGPGSPNYVTEIVRKIVVDADVVVGYKYTLDVIADLIKDKKNSCNYNGRSGKNIPTC
jgi:Precorrin-6B methylase 1